MAKKKNKALKSLEKDVSKLRKRNDKLAQAIAKTQEDQAAAYEELRSLLEERLPAQKQKDGSHDGEAKPEVTSAAIQRAEVLGIDLSSAKGTGARGRILVKDVEAAASRD